MTRKTALFAIVTLFLAAGCVVEEARETPLDGTPEGAERLASEMARDPEPDVTSEARSSLIAGNSTFATDLYQRVRAEAEGNFFFSPHSISVALVMTYGGADGETKRQMAETLHFGLPDSELHAAFNELDASLASRETNLDIINSCWAQRDYSFLPSYLDLIAENYGAGMYVLDFATDPNGSREIVNGWVEDRTAGRIVDLLGERDVDSYTRMILTNAIFFDAGWKTIFDIDETTDQDFHRADGTTVSVPMMHMTTEMRHGFGDGWQAVELPYNYDEMAMIAILPDADRPDLDVDLAPELIDEVLASLHEDAVAISLPRFSYGFDLPLSNHLQEMGMVDAFYDDRANFSRLDGTLELYIQTVVHQAFVEVTETGTEASAATAVVIGTRSEPPAITFDRPFIFLIRDLETGAILFLGRVVDPSAE